MDNCIKKTEVNRRLKRLISSIKNTSPNDILLRHDLISDLRFTERGLRALSVLLNDTFEDVEVSIAPVQVTSTRTVRELSNLIWGDVPDDKKC